MLRVVAISLLLRENFHFISFANLFPPPVPSVIFFPFFSLLQLFIPHLLCLPHIYFSGWFSDTQRVATASHKRVYGLEHDCFKSISLEIGTAFVR